MLIGVVKHLRSSFSARKDPVVYARSIGVKVGENCRFLGFGPAMFGSEPFLVTIGDHVTITSGVRFVTHDGGVWVFREEYPDIDVFGPICVESNVFIGLNCIILPGVTIGHDSVIGAGSVVTKDVPPNSVAAGIPARVIQSTPDYREKVLQKATHIRSRSYREKRKYLTERFRNGRE